MLVIRRHRLRPPQPLEVRTNRFELATEAAGRVAVMAYREAYPVYLLTVSASPTGLRQHRD